MYINPIVLYNVLIMGIRQRVLTFALAFNLALHGCGGAVEPQQTCIETPTGYVLFTANTEDIWFPEEGGMLVVENYPNSNGTLSQVVLHSESAEDIQMAIEQSGAKVVGFQVLSMSSSDNDGTGADNDLADGGPCQSAVVGITLY
jgi:hypothetical protein